MHKGIWHRSTVGLVMARSVAAWFSVVAVSIASLAQAAPVHGIAMHGEPAHSADMQALPYVNPNAPKGGRLRLGVVGSFDSLNIFSFKGEKGAGGARVRL